MSAELGDGIAKTADYALLAEGDHGVKERRSDGLAYDGDANGVDQEPGFDTRGFGNGASRVVAGIVIPFGERGQSGGGIREQVFDFRGLFPEFFLGNRIANEIVGEKCARPSGEIR